MDGVSGEAGRSVSLTRTHTTDGAQRPRPGRQESDVRIGILTGGGDVPGLNPCIKAVVNRVHEQGHQVTGIRRGGAVC